MSNPICDAPQYLMNLDKIWYGSPGREGFRAPLFVHNGHPAIMSPGDKIARCFIPQDVVILNVPGEYLQINNTIVSITPLINALNPITGSGVPTQSPTGYGSKSNVYYDLTGKITYVWNGTQWIPMCGCGTGTGTPTTPVTPTCAISVLPTSVLNSSLRQGDAVNISVQVTGTVATATASVSNGALPAGLGVSYLANGTSGTVVVSGTPSVSGSFTAAIKVGIAGCEATIPVALTVAAASGGGGGTPTPTPTPTTPTPTTPCTLDAGGDWMLSTTPNVPVNVTRNLTGKIPATASLIKLSGDLEAGFNITWSYPTLTVSGQSANLSNGKFAVYRFVDSATGCTKDFQVRVDVQTAACNLTLSPDVVNITATQGTAIANHNVTLANTPSGTDTLLESGALPSGVSLSLVAGQIVISGTPTVSGTFTANYYVGTVECWKILTINMTVAAAQASCTIATDKNNVVDTGLYVGIAMRPQQFTVTGIPTGYEVTSRGDMPPGITVNTPQVLSNTSIRFTVSGTPTTAGEYSVVARLGTASCATEIPLWFIVHTPSGGGGGGYTPTPGGGGTGGGGTGECNIVIAEVNTAITGTVGTALSF